MAISNFTEFNLPNNAYAAFDAVSMKQLIINRLKQSDVLKDVDYEGSNISALVDVIAYMYHVLLFYLNQTASEATFSQAEIFENINKIVSLIGYKPHGYHTPNVTLSLFEVSKNLPVGSYCLPRFTTINVDGSPYVFTDDVFFEKTNSSISENIQTVIDNNILYQGEVKEYPTITALGESFETVIMALQNTSNLDQRYVIDHNNIFVFVKDVYTQLWQEWNEVDSLYGRKPRELCFEKRFNENYNYEIKFGDNLNGKKLNQGDLVAIYYLASKGFSGKIGNNLLFGRFMSLYNNNRWSFIYNDIKRTGPIQMDIKQLPYITMDNDLPSSDFKTHETTTEIKNNAPLSFMSQNRAVTINDFETKIKSNFSNIIHDVRTVNNQLYTKYFLKYFYDIGLERPNQDEKILLNQLLFADSCDFNNVYCFVVPKFNNIINETTPIALPTSQKQFIVQSFNETKLINQNVVVCDPVFLAFDIGLPFQNEVISDDTRSETKIRIYRDTNSSTSKELIKSTTIEIINNFFSTENNYLGATIDISQLSQSILNISGVSRLETYREYENDSATISKLNFIVWNPNYDESTYESISQNYRMEYFQFPYLYQKSNLINKIEVI
jgi:hypothetical protein